MWLLLHTGEKAFSFFLSFFGEGGYTLIPFTLLKLVIVSISLAEEEERRWEDQVKRQGFGFVSFMPLKYIVSTLQEGDFAEC